MTAIDPGGYRPGRFVRRRFWGHLSRAWAPGNWLSCVLGSVKEGLSATKRGKIWRRRADSNRRIEVLQTSALTTWLRRLVVVSPGSRAFHSPAAWCRGWDLNPHRHTPTAPSRPRVYQFHHLGLTWMKPYYITSSRRGNTCIDSHRTVKSERRGLELEGRPSWTRRLAAKRY